MSVHAGPAHAAALAAAISSLQPPVPARAEISVGLESLGYLRSSPDRPDASAFLDVSGSFRHEGRAVEAAADPALIGYLKRNASFTGEAANAYVATSPALLAGEHQLTLGRRDYDWSLTDEQWRLGLWSPRFTWDPYVPQQIGRTGLFYSWSRGPWRALAFGSGIHVPERGVPLREDGGRLTSDSPDWIPLYEQLALPDQNLDIHYSIRMPPMRELLLHASAAAQLRYQGGHGTWLSLGCSTGPVGAADLTAQASLVAATGEIEVQLRPRVLRHDVATVESGWRGERGSVWVSGSREIPRQARNETGWTSAPAGPAWIAAAGGRADVGSGVAVSVAGLGIFEEAGRADGSSVTELPLPTRYPLRKAARLGADWRGPGSLQAAVTGTRDLEHASLLASARLGFGLARGWKMELGADLIFAGSGQGFIGEHRGGDRFLTGVRYGF
jgi:hypothetical protein